MLGLDRSLDKLVEPKLKVGIHGLELLGDLMVKTGSEQSYYPRGIEVGTGSTGGLADAI